jgi:tripartite ATP-independent transporter DctP family solute receptor
MRCLAPWLLAGVLLTAASTLHAERQLRLGSPWPTNSPPHAGLEAFARAAGAESGGRLRVVVYPDSQLGDIQALITGVQTGTVDMTYLSVGNASVLKGGAALNVAYVPYLFDSRGAAEQAVNSALFQDLYEALARTSGVRIFAAYGSRLPRAINTVRGPVSKPADLKGMKIRVPPIELLRAAFERLGAKPVVMGLSDTYMAISRGQVDGQENGVDAMVAYKWYEVAKHLSTTEHVYEVAAYYVNEKVWQSLDAADRDALVRAARTGGAAMNAAGDRLAHDADATLRQAGVSVTVPDRAAFQAALKDLHLRYEGRLWPAGLVDKIRALQKGATRT